ncbi:hypothetical protein KUH03_27230 [Sphingobacterium sp. E70]|uniref:hypothetical protein n=1 Tax=Sphingobacterium sp. E70 TaxID=2853439 RepID=UPI00211BE21A|nr:hypothetical protein [Sphingobacterium sp. E70]ULT22941.1 hypothetical protein KUH03_27230 [Sphingobacterium sp. E70]
MNLQTIFLYLLLFGFASCQQTTQSNPQTIPTKDSVVNNQSQQATESPQVVKPLLDTSTYTNPRFNKMANQQREQLVKLADEDSLKSCI